MVQFCLYGGDTLETLYIDVYFLINFTVDVLALYFASLFISITTSKFSLILSGLAGALYAVAAILLDNGLLKLAFGLLFGVLITAISARGVGYIRKVKFFIAFILLETLIGGVVFFGYSILDKLLYKYIGTNDDGGENRGILIMAIIVLLSIGVFKLFLALFTASERASAVRVIVKESGFEYGFDAFLDTGNLAKDPIDMTPVLFVKGELAKRIFTPDVLKENSFAHSGRYDKKIRIIPTSFGGTSLVYGIRPDEAFVVTKDRTRVSIRVVIAIDKEGGTYGGYNALLPSSAIDNVVL